MLKIVKLQAAGVELMSCMVNKWRLPWNNRLSVHLWRLSKKRLKFSRWIRMLLDFFELSKVVPFIKSRKTRWNHYVWVNKEDLYNCIALLFIYSVHTNVCELGGWSGYYYSTCTLVPSIHHLHLHFGTSRGKRFLRLLPLVPRRLHAE